MRVLRQAISMAIVLGSGIAVTATAQDTRLDHYGLGPARLRALCASAHPGNAATLFQQSLRLQLALRQRDATVDSWRTYGCVSSLLYAEVPREASGRDTVVSHNARPAIDAFITVLDSMPGDSIAATGLAALALDISGGSNVNAILGYIPAFAQAGYRAVRAGVTVPAVMRMCTDFALADADMATARYCSGRAFALGVDSTWHLLRASRLAYMGDDPVAGGYLHGLAAAVARDSGAIGEVTWNSNEPAEFPESIFALCPLSVTLNGTRMPADRSRCTGSTPHPLKQIGLTFTVTQLWNPATGLPLSLVMYVMQEPSLLLTFAPTSRSALVDFDVRRYEWETGRWIDTTSTIRVPVPNDFSTDLTGYFLFSPPAAISTWTLEALQPGRRGGESVDNAWPIGAGPYSLSDLVLGSPEQHTSLILADDTIMLAPLVTVRRSKPFDLYYQLRSDSAGPGFTTRILLRHIEGGHVTPAPELTFTFASPVARGINPIHRQIDLSRVAKGDHQLEVMVVDAAGRVVARRATYVVPH
jgi:hypothetical protein